MFDIRIYKYAMAYEVAKFIEFEFGISEREAYDKLLENDYIESQLGSRFCITDHINTEIDEWIQTFMLRWELEEIQLKYGN